MSQLLSAIQSGIGVVLAIILVDLTLSGDNALVIGAVASRLKGRQRRQAIILGSIMAIALRIVLVLGAAFILGQPFLQAFGGLIVFVIAVRLIIDLYKGEGNADGTASGKGLASNTTLLQASVAILFADVSMSLDNILAIAALARNQYVLLLIGLFISIGLLLVASSFFAVLIERFPMLMYLAGFILAFTAGSMFVNDRAPQLHSLFHTLFLDKQIAFGVTVMQVVMLVIFGAISFVIWRRHRIAQAKMPVPAGKERIPAE